MSMLAERKRKQKFNLNPRGKLWSDDTNKFGQKMLEKMGWTTGKGLGANEDGMTEHVKQTYKNDVTGIGFKDDDNKWTQHEAQFTSLLNNLVGDTPETTAPKVPLEQKSQSSRKRVHYHKFTRGKDLTVRSEKDIAQIFGKKSLKDQPKQPENEETEDKNFGVVTIQAGSITDYFKSKMSNLKIKRESDNPDRDSETDERPSFSMNNPNTSTLGMSSLNIETPTKDETKKKKKNTKVVITECFDNPGFVDFANDDNYGATPSKKRKLETITEDENETKQNNEVDAPIKKKKKKSRKDVETNDDTNEDAKKKKSKNKDVENPVCNGNDNETITEEKKKKKSKDKPVENPIHNGNDNETLTEETKKKKSKGKGVENSNLNENDVETSTVKTKKKKSKNKDLETSTFNGNDKETITEDTKTEKSKSNGSETPSLNDTDNSITEQSKRKKSKNKGIENPSFDENETIPDEYVDEPVKKKKKSNKKNKIEGITNLACTEFETTQESIETSPKKHKKKSKVGIENPACAGTDTIDTADQSNPPVENANEVVRKKSKKRKSNGDVVENGVDNPGCVVNSIEHRIKETIASVSDAVDEYQLELENKINEGKEHEKKAQDIWNSLKPKTNDRVLNTNETNGHVNDTNGENGNHRGRANFNRSFGNNRDLTDKKSVKDIIQGAPRMEFRGANLFKLAGYGIK